MTFLEILQEYEPGIKVEYASNYYNDMRKKLLVAFECVGLYSLEIFKADNGKDYSFLESSKAYLFHLLDMETSSLFRNIKGCKMTMDDYVVLSTEVEQLLEFIKPYTKNENEYKRIVSEIFSNVRYPIIKRYADFQNTYYSFSAYCESLIKNDGVVTGISNWECLTEDDKVKLLDELITYTKKWVNLVEKFGEYRADEAMTAIYNIPIDDIQISTIVDDAIRDEYCKIYYERFPTTIKKSRSIKATYAKVDAQNDEAYKLKLSLAKKYCDEHNIDFKKYLSEQEMQPDPGPVSTEKAFEDILKEM